MIRLSSQITKILLQHEEYGMGFQIGTVIFSNYSRQRGLIFNASLLCPIDEYQSLTSIQKDYSYALRNAQATNNIIRIEVEPRNLDNIKKVRSSHVNFSEGIRVHAQSKLESGPAEKAEITWTKTGEIFKRFSAYEKDFRITDKNGLVPGTFATTEEDAKNIKNGMEVVARYALENKASANNVFTIKPKENTKLKRGTAEPKYGEPGGGAEVIFVDGTSDNTVTGPVKIPEK